MTTLTAKYKSQLRAQAHALKPVILTGNHGLTEALHAEIDRALHDHELIKVRINAATREDRLQMAHDITEKQQAELVQLIGHIAVFYRKNTAVIPVKAKPKKKAVKRKQPRATYRKGRNDVRR